MGTALERAADLHTRAVELHNLGHPAQARRKLLAAQHALSRVDADLKATHLLARIGITLALVDSELFGSAHGRAGAEQALELAQATGDPALVVPAAGQLGLIAMRMGELRRAVDVLDSVGPHLGGASGPDRFAVLLNLGTARMFLGELGAGRATLVAALEAARGADLPRGEFKALHNLAYLDFLLGDLPSALNRMDLALARNPGMSLGIPLLDRARVLSEAGLVSHADAALAAAMDIFGADRLAQDLGEAELERARCALVAADIPAARGFAGSARTRFARRGSDRWRQSAELVLLQADLAAGRPGRRLVGPARRLGRELAVEGLHTLAMTASLIAAEAALSAGDLAEATAEMTALGPARRSDPISYRLHAAYVAARLDAVSGRQAQSTGRLRRALDDLAQYQAGFGSIDLSTAAAVHGRRLAELDMALAIDTGRVAGIFRAAERGRAVTSRLSPVRPPEDRVTAELLAELRQTVESLRGVQLDALRAAPLTRRRQELETQVAQRAWSRRGLTEVRATSTFGDTRGTLREHTMAMFVVSGEVVGAMVLDDSRARYLELGTRRDVIEHVRRVRADLDVLAQPQLRGPIATAVRASLERSVACLDELLIRPLKLDRRLVLSTTGLLGQVPWGTLPSLRGVPIEVAPSATAWMSARTVGTRTGGRRLVSVAGPGLARSSEEAREVAKAWGLTTTLSGAAATGAALSTAMSKARVVHVAAHGMHQTENPLFSSIRLADGPLFAHELDQTAGTPEHVVLSACELGLATIRPGDEALGLTSVLLRLGTHSVVAGVARIGDDHAAESMAAYHRHLARGMDSAAALARASEAADVPLPLVCFGATWSVK